jgi:hypothetical protein
MWKSEFIDQLVAGPFMAFGIWFALSVISSTGDSSAITTPPAEGLTEKGRFQNAGVGEDVGTQTNSVYTMIIGAALLYGVFEMSKSMAGQAAAVGKQVFSGSKALVGAGFKRIDEAWGAGTKVAFGKDLSVGGAVDTAKAGYEKMSKGWAFLRAKADSVLQDKRDARLKKGIEGDERHQMAKSSFVANKASKQMIEEILGKDKKALALRDHLKGLEKEGGLSAGKKKKLEDAITKAKAGDFSELGALMGDKDYKFSDDLKQKMSNFESMGQTLSDSEGTVSRFSQYMSATGENEKIDAKTLQGMVSAGILTDSEAAGLTNMTWREYQGSNPSGVSDIKKKMAGYRTLLNQSRSGSASGWQTALTAAKASGFNTDKFDVFKSATGEMGNLDADIMRGSKASKALRAWQSGRLAPGSAEFMDAQTLGLDGGQLGLLKAESLQTSEDRKPQMEEKKKEVERKMQAASAEMSKIAAEYWSEYHSRITTRAISKRAQGNEKIFDDDFEARFSQFRTPDDLARLWKEQKSTEIRRRILKKAQSLNIKASTMLKHVGVAPNSTGLTKVILELGNQLNAGTQKIIEDLEKTGKVSSPDDEIVLKQAMDVSIKDPLVRESVQQLLQYAGNSDVQEAEFVLKTDNVTGDIEATPFSERWKIDLDALKSNRISTKNYRDYTTEDGVLTNVGGNYFSSHGAYIHRNPQDYPEQYVTALATYKDQILSELAIQFGENSEHYNNRKEDLDKISRLTYRRTIGKTLPFIDFRF